MMDDLYKLDLNGLKWIRVSSAAGNLPLARCNHGFIATFGKLYLFGGKASPRGNVSCVSDVALISSSVQSICFVHSDPDPVYSIFASAKNTALCLDLL
jgi:hypothetical protein